ncbi:MAG: SLC13 family permease, partial [Corallincola sp.]|nr:SLC13 family permease [Corallincola sp.]
MSLGVEAWLTISLFVGLLAALISGRVNATTAFGVVLLIVVGSGLVTTSELIKSAANPGIVTLLLLAVSLGLEKTQWLGRIAHTLIGKTLDGT